MHRSPRSISRGLYEVLFHIAYARKLLATAIVAQNLLKSSEHFGLACCYKLFAATRRWVPSCLCPKRLLVLKIRADFVPILSFVDAEALKITAFALLFLLFRHKLLLCSSGCFFLLLFYFFFFLSLRVILLVLLPTRLHWGCVNKTEAGLLWFAVSHYFCP